MGGGTWYKYCHRVYVMVRPYTVTLTTVYFVYYLLLLSLRCTAQLPASRIKSIRVQPARREPTLSETR